MTTIQHMTRQQWGYRETGPISPLPSPTDLDYVFVHHTAGRHPLDPVAAFRRLNDSCIAEGHRAIYYNWLVHYNPTTDVLTVAEGRGAQRSGATKDQNLNSITVCVLGYFHPGTLQTPLYDAHVLGVAIAIADAVKAGHIFKPGAIDGPKILGHRDNPKHVGATACPGDVLYARVPGLAPLVDFLLAPPAQPTLKLGDKSCEVAELQTRVRRYDTAMVVDGVFGAETDRIVRNWQAFFGHPVTGVVAEPFWDLLDALDKAATH